MSKSLYDIIPTHDDVLALEPEELAGVLLEMWNSATQAPKLNRHNFGLYYTVQEYPQQYHSDLIRALMEAWSWLEREGFIAPMPQEEGWFFITRRGMKVRSRDALASYRKADMLPRGLLHPVIAEKVWATFLRGDYDTAVFQAFKEVEVRVRDAAGLGPNDLGADLMRKAFNETTGPLTDISNPVLSERQALAHLFAGAIGSYKNPHSHRNVEIDATEAVEMIILASHLMRIVESRVP